MGSVSMGLMSSDSEGIINSGTFVRFGERNGLAGRRDKSGACNAASGDLSVTSVDCNLKLGECRVISSEWSFAS